MAEKEIMMKEIVDPIYQLHRGENAESIESSLRFDRKTIRQLVNCSRTWSFIESNPSPAKADVIERIKALTGSSRLWQTPAKDLIRPHRDWIGELLEYPKVTAKQVDVCSH